MLPRCLILGDLINEDFKTNTALRGTIVRILAFAIDYLFIATYLLALVLGLFLRRIFSDFLPTIFSDPLLGEIAGLVVLTLPVTLFFSLFESSLWQAIFGKNGIG